MNNNHTGEHAMSIDLQRFCAGPDDIHSRTYDFSRPFVRDGWRYATQGAICIRVPAADEPDTVGNFPPAQNFFTGDVWRKDMKPWPEPYHLWANDPCEVCGGQGHDGDEEKPCKSCGGVGCDECGQSGADIGAACLRCGGKGGYIQPAYQKLDGLHAGHHIALRYDRLIRSLPGVRFAVPDKPSARFAPRPVVFRFDGGEGVIMPALETKDNPAIDPEASA